VKYGDDVLVAYPGGRTESTLIQLNQHIADYGKVVKERLAGLITLSKQ
jgi:hypothetical protein